MSDKASFVSSSETLISSEGKSDSAARGKGTQIQPLSSHSRRPHTNLQRVDTDNTAAKTTPLKMSDSAAHFDKLAKENGWAATTPCKPSM